jgi:prepilin-type N-terminal cleavage/methylation domain-containing protein
MLTKLKSLNKRESNRGFTIIEVMIVLAIAGLILLIVFLAVPALQRSARNTQRKNDAAAVAAGVANFIADNGGALPTALGYSSADTTSALLYCATETPSIGAGNTLSAVGASGNAGLIAACTSTNTETAKLGYYKLSTTTPNVFFNNAGSSTTFSASTASGTASTTNVTTESLIIDLGYSCNSTNTGVAAAASSRSAAILYATETSGGANLLCVEQ